MAARAPRARRYRNVQATNWEFKNRALVFGLIFGCSFLYGWDHQNSAAWLANWMGARLAINGDLLARILFAVAAGLLFVAALVRTWGSSYLHATIVYARDVKSETLVADGPYRYVRNPLYLGNMFLVLGLGAMMSRAGFFAAFILMLVFCYRLILREESGMETNQPQQYEPYRHAVPRLWPAFAPRVPSAGRQPQWSKGFKAEFWCWGIALSVAVFAIFLNPVAYFAILAVSLAVFWLSSSLLRKLS